MKRFIKSKKGFALLAVLVVAAAAAIGGYAYFTDSGSGSGSATVGTSAPWSVTVGSPTGGTLYPGQGTDTFSYTVKNVGSGNQQLNKVEISVANAGGTAWSSGACSANDFSVDGQTAGATATDTYGLVADDLAPNATQDGSITLQMVDSNSPQDDCQGVTVPLYVSAS
jgi:hypothetical protein